MTSHGQLDDFAYGTQVLSMYPAISAWLLLQFICLKYMLSHPFLSAPLSTSWFSLWSSSLVQKAIQTTFFLVP